MKNTNFFTQLFFFTLLFIFVPKTNAQTDKKPTETITWGTPQMNELAGYWKESFNDNNLELTFNTSDFTGEIKWNGGNKITFEWKVKLNPDKSIMFIKDESNASDNNLYCQILIKATSESVQSEYDKIGETYLYFCKSASYLDGAPPAIIERYKKWFFVKK